MCRFGTVALVLQLVPMLSMFFLLTTAAGSAIWASELEQKRLLIEEHTSLIGEAEYRDDPS